jgi:hypothetical protein
MSTQEYEDLLKWTRDEFSHQGFYIFEDVVLDNGLRVFTEKFKGVYLKPEMQVKIINRRLRHRIMMMSCDTTDIRMLIMDTDNVNEWKSLMSSRIIPYIIEHINY